MLGQLRIAGHYFQIADISFTARGLLIRALKGWEDDLGNAKEVEGEIQLINLEGTVVFTGSVWTRLALIGGGTIVEYEIGLVDILTRGNQGPLGEYIMALAASDNESQDQVVDLTAADGEMVQEQCKAWIMAGGRDGINPDAQVQCFRERHGGPYGHEAYLAGDQYRWYDSPADPRTGYFG